MSRAFSKILVLVILIVLAAGGIFAWQYWWIPKEETRTPEEITSRQELEEAIKEWGSKFGEEKEFPAEWIKREFPQVSEELPTKTKTNNTGSIDVGTFTYRTFLSSKSFLPIIKTVLAADEPRETRILVYEKGEAEERDLYLYDFLTGDIKRLTQDGFANFSPSYSESQRKVIYYSDEHETIEVSHRTKIRAKILDLDTLESETFDEETQGPWYFFVSPDGKKVAYIPEYYPMAKLAIINLENYHKTEIPISNFRSGTIYWSSDSKRIYFRTEQKGKPGELTALLGTDISEYNLETSELKNLTSSEESEAFPYISSDGQYLSHIVEKQFGEESSNNLFQIKNLNTGERKTFSSTEGIVDYLYSSKEDKVYFNKLRNGKITVYALNILSGESEFLIGGYYIAGWGLDENELVMMSVITSGMQGREFGIWNLKEGSYNKILDTFLNVGIEIKPDWQATPSSGESWARDESGTVIITRIDGLNFYNELSDSAQIISTIPYGSKIQINKIGGTEEKPGTWYYGIWQNKEGWFDRYYTLKNLSLFQEDFYHYKYFENYLLKVPDKLYGFNLKIYGEENLPSVKNIQMPNNRNIGLDKIRVKVIYFRPKEIEAANYYKTNDPIKENWFENLDKAFKRIQSFHEKEFTRYDIGEIEVKKSTFEYDIYSSIVRGKQPDGFYRGITYNSSQLLLSVIDEVREEVFSPEEKYYKEDFVAINPDEHPIIIVITETGAIGGRAIERRAVISADLFRSGNCYGAIPCFESFLPVLYHEILHTIGLTDEYISGPEMEFALLNESIMAKTNIVPLESNYISKKVKNMMFR